MVTRQDAAVERMASLTFALLGAARSSVNPFRTAEWIQSNVSGYPRPGEGKDSQAAFRKQLQRDVQLLKLAGVPIIYHKGTGAEPTKVRIDEDAYQLPKVEFTTEEAMILGLASGLSQAGGLSVFSQTAWTKIAATGASKGASAIPHFVAHSDMHRISPQDFSIVVEAIEKYHRLSFTYTSRPTAEPEQRRLDPWGLVTREGRAYLVGWDLGRAAVRAFRITRVRGFRKQAAPDFHPHQGNSPVAEIVSEFLEPTDLVDAVVRIPVGTALEISALGTRTDGDLVELQRVSATWLARTAIGYAPAVEVISPESVRREICALAAAAQEVN